MISYITKYQVRLKFSSFKKQFISIGIQITLQIGIGW